MAPDNSPAAPPPAPQGPAAELVLPIVHYGGTHPDTLLEQRTDTLHALRTAAAALEQMAPNGRDYLGDFERLGRATLQAERRRLALAALIREIEQETEALADVILGP